MHSADNALEQSAAASGLLGPRTLYVELLIKVLANTIYEDRSMDPWHPSTFRLEDRTGGVDWPATAHSMIGLKRLHNLASLTQRVIDERIPGDLIETGVWRGGACILMKGVLASNGVRDRKVFVCDSFEGLPPPDEAKFPNDANDMHHTFKELAIPLEVVRSNFQKYDLLDDQVVFVKGFFEDTLPKLSPTPLAIMRLDGDMYQSTIEALTNLYPRLSAGGFVIIDDYGAVPACQAAVVDFRQAHAIEDEMFPIDGIGVWWQRGLSGGA